MSYAKVALGKRGFGSPTAPVLVRHAISRDGLQLTAWLDQFIDASNPLTGWTVTVDDVVIALSNPVIRGDSVTFDLAERVYVGAGGTLNYSGGTIVGEYGGLSLGDFEAPISLVNDSVVDIADEPSDPAPELLGTPSVDETGLYVYATFTLPLAPTSSLTGWSLTGVTLESIAVVGATVILQAAAPIPYDQPTMTLAYDAGPGTVTGETGTVVASFSATVQNNSDAGVAPELDGVPTIDISGQYITATFSQPLAPSTATTGWSATGLVFSSVSVIGSTVLLQVTVPIRYDAAAITLNYSSTTGELEGLSGTPVASFSAAVLNRSTVGQVTTLGAPELAGFPSVGPSGLEVTVPWDRAIAAHMPTAGFVLRVNGASVALSSGYVAGSLLILQPVDGIVAGATVTLSYSGGTVVSTESGIYARRFGATEVVNNSALVPPVVDAVPYITAEGTQLVVRASRAVTSSPSVSAGWTLVVNGVTIGIAGGSTSGSTIRLTLSSVVASGLNGTLTYSSATGTLVAVDGGLPLQDYSGSIQNNWALNTPKPTSGGALRAVPLLRATRKPAASRASVQTLLRATRKPEASNLSAHPLVAVGATPRGVKASAHPLVATSPVPASSGMSTRTLVDVDAHVVAVGTSVAAVVAAAPQPASTKVTARAVLNATPQPTISAAKLYVLITL